MSEGYATGHRGMDGSTVQMAVDYFNSFFRPDPVYEISSPLVPMFGFGDVAGASPFAYPRNLDDPFNEAIYHLKYS